MLRSHRTRQLAFLATGLVLLGGAGARAAGTAASWRGTYTLPAGT